MINALLVGAGGFLGSIARYLLSGWVQEIGSHLHFPYGTLVVNIVGCLVIGIISALADGFGFFTPRTRLLIIIGFLGGFTTFSSFSNEAVNLFQGGSFWSALVDVGAHLLLGLGAVWLGRMLVYWIWN